MASAGPPSPWPPHDLPAKSPVLPVLPILLILLILPILPSRGGLVRLLDTGEAGAAHWLR